METSGSNARTEEPAIEADILPEAMPGQFNVLAIVVGVLTDIVVTTLTVFVVMFLAGVIIGMELSVAPQPTPELLAERIEAMTTMWVSAVLLGACGTFVGGYVSACIAKVMPVWHAVVVGCVSAVLGLLAYFVFGDVGSPAWVTPTAQALTIPAATLGGFLRGSGLAAQRAEVA